MSLQPHADLGTMHDLISASKLQLFFLHLSTPPQSTSSRSTPLRSTPPRLNQHHPFNTARSPHPVQLASCTQIRILTNINTASQKTSTNIRSARQDERSQTQRSTRGRGCRYPKQAKHDSEAVGPHHLRATRNVLMVSTACGRPKNGVISKSKHHVNFGELSTSTSTKQFFARLPSSSALHVLAVRGSRSQRIRPQRLLS